MKRRNKSWLIAALVALSAVMVLTGCSLSQVLSLTIVDYPATTYVRSNTTPDIEFTVEAKMDNGDTKTLTYNEYSSVLKLSGFSTEEIGTFTATVTYRNVSATFDYEVVAASEDFAGGVGTETNPYIINTLDQFKKIPDYSNSHFKLGADIDFSSLPFSGESTLIGKMNGGSLDGNGYKLYNFVKETAVESGIFTSVENATIKNLEVHATIYAPLAWEARSVIFDNVDCYGEVVLPVGFNNYGNYCIYAYGNCVFTNCTNYREIRGASLYAAAFVGYRATAQSITFENCVNEANITAIGAGVLCANSNSSTQTITIKDCINRGTISGTRYSNFVFGWGMDDETLISNDYIAGNITVIADDSVENKGGTFVLKEGPTVSNQAAADSKLQLRLSSLDNVGFVWVAATYYTNMAEGGTLLRTKDQRISGSSFTANEWFTTDLYKVKSIYAGGSEDWGFEDGKYYELAVEGKYGLTSASATLHYYVVVFDTDGNLLGGTDFTA